MKPYLLAHDLGTSGNKATLFSTDGDLLGSRISSYRTYYSNKNWSEQDPEDWWKAVCESTHSLLSGRKAEEIGVVCFSGQMMGCLCVDRTGRPLRTSIIYSDQRSEVQIAKILEKLSAEEIYRICGHRASPSYSISKLMWIKDNEPEIYANTYKMLNAKDYINYKLTGVYCTEYNDASGTNAFDISELRWSEKIIAAAEIDFSKFPPVCKSTSVIGAITKAAAEATGLKEGTPVVAGAGDGGCATVGTGSVDIGIAYNYLGSSSWISTTSAEPIFDDKQRTFTWVHPVPGFYQPCGTMQTAGSSYEWLKAEICHEETLMAKKRRENPYEEINKEIARSPAGSNGVLFLPYLLGERSPRWNPQAKGAWVGIKLETKREDILRSVLEGVSMNLEIILAIMKRYVQIEEITLVGGGAKGTIWRHILSDIFGIPVLIPQYLEEATSMGAAVIGGVGTGILESFNDVERFITITDKISPNPETVEIYNQIKPIFDACYESLKQIFKNL